jgi:hypothetical protein
MATEQLRQVRLATLRNWPMGHEGPQETCEQFKHSCWVELALMNRLRLLSQSEQVPARFT